MGSRISLLSSKTWIEACDGILIRYFMSCVALIPVFSFCPIKMLAKDPSEFRTLVQESLRRQVVAINKLSDAGLFFWDYGNAFLLEARRAGANVSASGGDDPLKFRYPSYVQDIMG